MASGMFQSLRQDLITDAFAYRPLAPMRTDGPVTRRLPRRIRPYMTYLPHAVVGFVAFFVVMLTSTTSGEYVAASSSLVMGLVAATPVLMTLVRPVGAFWAAIAATGALAVVGSSSNDVWPWSPGAFVSYLATVTFAAMRTRPRAAGWMWLITLGIGIGIPVVLGRGSRSRSCRWPSSWRSRCWW